MSTEEIWLTYDQAAERLSVKPDSVRRRAAKRKWPRRMRNDGLAEVGIPADAIPPAPVPGPTPAAIPALEEDISGELREKIAASAARIEGLEARLADTQAERDRLAALLEKALEARPGLIARIFGRS